MRHPLLPLLAALLLGGCSSSLSPANPGGDDAGTGDDAATPDAGDGAAPQGDAGVSGDAAPPPSSQIRVIVEPSDKGAALLAAIQNATKSVHMTMYLLTSNEIVSALVAQHQAGHDVKVVLDKNGVQSSNQSAYDTLSKAGVAVHWAPSNFTYTHEKCVIVDATQAWIMTMNATYSSPTSNREYLAVDDGAADIAEAEAIFQADYANKAITPKGPLVVAPVNARDDLVAMVQTAKKTIDIEAEEMSDTAFVDALDTASDAGVAVHIVLSDATPYASQDTAVALLKQHGVKLVQVSKPYIHAKSMVVDGATAFVGSENFSGGSLGYNREVGVIFGIPSEVQKVLTTTVADFGKGTPL